MLYIKNSYRLLRHTIITPIVWACVIPLVILDICAEIYHRVCFPLYGIPYVKRDSYIKIDRHKLKYINLRQKIYCVYCGYANGVINYWSRIAAETERYWCGIKHKEDGPFVPPAHHKYFPKYGDEDGFKRRYIEK